MNNKSIPVRCVPPASVAAMSVPRRGDSVPFYRDPMDPEGERPLLDPDGDPTPWMDPPLDPHKDPPEPRWSAPDLDGDPANPANTPLWNRHL